MWRMGCKEGRKKKFMENGNGEIEGKNGWHQSHLTNKQYACIINYLCNYLFGKAKDE